MLLLPFCGLKWNSKFYTAGLEFSSVSHDGQDEIGSED